MILSIMGMGAGLACLRPDLLYQFGPPCLVTMVFGPGISWGCGITHAIIEVLHGNISGAFHYNKSVIIVFPILAFVTSRYVIRVITVIYKETPDKP